MNLDWRDYTQTTEDGHLMWTGRVHKTTPVGTDRHRSIRPLAYQQQKGHAPVGLVRSICGHVLCLQGEHLTDREERQSIYRARAEARGLATTDGYCPHGHVWEENAVFLPGGWRTCRGCRRGTDPDDHSVSLEIVLSGRPELLPRTLQLEAAQLLICRQGATHQRVAELVGRSPRTVSRWASVNGWRKPQSLANA